MEDEYWTPRDKQEFSGERTNRIGAVNMALLFGTAAIALSLVLTPLLAPEDSGSLQAAMPDYDNITTGSIAGKDGGERRYTIRRSVTQNPGEACIISPSGQVTGCR